MINFDDVTKENIKEHNPNWPQIHCHPYKILIIKGSRSAERNLLFSLVIHQRDIDKPYLYVKVPYEPKYQLLINRRESKGLKNLNGSKAFIKYSNDMDDIYKILKNTTQARNSFLMISLVIKCNPIVIELFIRGTRLSISLIFITRYYFAVPKILD